jgi:hypothetical protein
MNPNRLLKVIRTTFVGICAATMLLSSSCGVAELRALVAGVDAAADRLNGDHDDVSFRDWLADEIDD